MTSEGSFPRALSIWFQPENHLRGQEKQSHSCLLPQLCFIFELPAYPTGPDLHCPFIKPSYSKCLFIYVQKFSVRQASFLPNLKNWGWRWSSYQFQSYLFDLATSKKQNTIMCPRVTARGGGHKKTDHVFHSSSASVNWIMTSIIYLLDSPPCAQAPNVQKTAGLCFKELLGWVRV